MQLPMWVSHALNTQLEGVSRNQLATAAKRLSDTYRAHGASTVIRTGQDALAYALTRMPATYAAVRHALVSAAARLPEFAPATLLDVGSGPGTATWAAVATWPGLRQLTLLDQNQPLLGLARQIGQQTGLALTATDVTLPTALGSATPADLVLASYALAEFPVTSLDTLLARLWPLAGSVLVLVEPGTPEGFRRILAARSWLIQAGAQIVAPCTHAGPCPLATGERWCHFRQRLSRSRDHQLVKSAAVNYEDEKLSYLVATRTPAADPVPRRILATPVINKSEVRLSLCAPEHAEILLIPHASKQAYKAARRLDWGDTWTSGPENELASEPASNVNPPPAVD